jgi:hypothetical protein
MLQRLALPFHSLFQRRPLLDPLTWRGRVCHWVLVVLLVLLQGVCEGGH